MSSPSDDAIELIVARIGGYAAERVHRACEGCVRAVFEHSAYVELGGQWLCIGGERIGCGPLNALVASGQPIRRVLATLVQDRPVRGTWPRFRTDRAQLDFMRAARWHPALPALPIDPARLARGVARMQRGARGRIPREGLAFVVANVDGAGVLVDPGTAAASALQAWLIEGQRRVFVDEKSSLTLLRSFAPLDALRRLIGLGPGLTPSGDDFLGGALVALHAFGKRHVARALGAWLLPLCERATHPVSIAHLEAAAHGEGGEALHACLLALADDRDPDDALDAIAAVGHTSGWDALAGATTVASAIGRG